MTDFCPFCLSTSPYFSAVQARKIAQVFLFIGSIGIERLIKHFVVQLCTIFKAVTDGALASINSKLVIAMSDTLDITFLA